MNESEKLRILIPHWIEHNGEHAEEFSEHAALAGAVKDKLLAASRLLTEANAELAAALDLLGGPQVRPEK